jgi:hypothetical protein
MFISDLPISTASKQERKSTDMPFTAPLPVHVKEMVSCQVSKQLT